MLTGALVPYGMYQGRIPFIMNNNESNEIMENKVEKEMIPYPIAYTERISRYTKEEKASYFEWSIKKRPDSKLRLKALKSELLFREFLDAERKMSPLELYGIASNLACINGGQNIYKTAVRDYNKKINKDTNLSNEEKIKERYTEKEIGLVSEWAGSKEPPMFFDEFFPYPLQHDYKTIMHMITGSYIPTEPMTHSELSLEEARERFKKEMERLPSLIIEALENPTYNSDKTIKPEVIIMLAHLGVGKSRYLQEYIRNAVVAWPRHDIIDIVYNTAVKRFNKNGHNIVRTHRIALPEDIRRAMEETSVLSAEDKSDIFALESYLEREQISLYRERAEKIFSRHPELKIIENYLLDSQYKFKNNREDKTIYTTHDKIMLGAFKHLDIAYFDEDIFDSMFKCSFISFFEINKLIDNEIESEELKRILNSIRYNKKDEIGFVHPPKGADKEWYQKVEKEIDMVGFASIIDSDDQEEMRFKPIGKAIELLKSFAYIATRSGIYFLNIRPFPAKVNIILSATPAIAQYRLMEKRGLINLRVIEIEEPELIADIKQFTAEATSKSALKDKDLSDVVEVYPRHNLITHLQTKENYKNNHCADRKLGHFFANHGSNSFTGEDLLVYGTPRKPAEYYALVASYLHGYDRSMNTEYSNKRVEYNGYSFTIAAPKHDSICEFYLESIHNELLQSIGRARPYEHPNDIVVYSEIPLRNARIKRSNKFKDNPHDIDLFLKENPIKK